MSDIISSLEDRSSNLFKGRASNGELHDNAAMKNEAWRQRLTDALAKEGKSKRRVSLDSGNGPGYVHSILSEGKDPTIDKLVSVCEAIPVSAIYILHGVNANPGDISILKALQGNPGARAGILALLGDSQP